MCKVSESIDAISVDCLVGMRELFTLYHHLEIEIDTIPVLLRDTQGFYTNAADLVRGVMELLASARQSEVNAWEEEPERPQCVHG